MCSSCAECCRSHWCRHDWCNRMVNRENSWLAGWLAGALLYICIFFLKLKKWEFFSCFLFLRIPSVHLHSSYQTIPRHAIPCHVILQKWLFTQYFFFMLSFCRWWKFFAFTRSMYLPVSWRRFFFSFSL